MDAHVQDRFHFLQVVPLFPEGRQDDLIRQLLGPAQGFDHVHVRAVYGHDRMADGAADGFARAAVADPPVLILDEATSSIDTRTEALVQRGMDGLMYGRTSFVIAHRLSTVRNADCIVVLEQGRIIERGSHDSLIAQLGRYYQLYTGVFELE